MTCCSFENQSTHFFSTTLFRYSLFKRKNSVLSDAQFLTMTQSAVTNAVLKSLISVRGRKKETSVCRWD